MYKTGNLKELVDGLLELTVGIQQVGLAHDRRDLPPFIIQF